MTKKQYCVAYNDLILGYVFKYISLSRNQFFELKVTDAPFSLKIKAKSDFLIVSKKTGIYEYWFYHEGGESKGLIDVTKYYEKFDDDLRNLSIKNVKNDFAYLRKEVGEKIKACFF